MAEPDFRPAKELLRAIAEGVEELRARPGHCSVVVQGAAATGSLPRAYRQLFPADGYWTTSIFAGPSYLEAQWTVDANSLRLRVVLEGRQIILEERWYFDGTEVPE